MTGAVDAEAERKESAGGKRGKRGSTDNSGRLKAFATRNSSGNASWGNCDPARLQTVIVEITDMGGAITIGLSRDGGAHSLTLLLDGDRQTMWFNGGADLDEELDLVLTTLTNMK